MSGQRQSFFEHIAQTSPFPLAMEVVKAEGMYLFDKSGKKYLDLISGIAVSNMGHSHPEIIGAVKEQAEKHMHLMVYGELIQSPQVSLAEELCKILPDSLNNIYYTNSGSEAVEGALKLAKRVTGRTDLICFRNAYHGSTQGALSVCGNEDLKNSFRPLIPGTRILDFNNFGQLEAITEQTAAVIVECIQAEAGIILPSEGYLQALSGRCRSAGALLIIDEIQTGMRRTGPWFAFQSESIVPDILVLGKGFGGGMPLGAFISSKENMSKLTEKPVLGHITTFGGHPLSCAAAISLYKLLKPADLEIKISRQENLFRKLLVHEKIKDVRGKGLFLCLEFENTEICHRIISRCIDKGLFTDWFLFAPHCMRIAPPLIILDHEIELACTQILEVLTSI